MKPTWFCIFLLFVFTKPARANSFQLRQKELPEANFRKTNDLILRASNRNVDQVSIELIDINGTPIRERFSKQLSASDYSNCSSYPCNVEVLRMPFSLEKGTCKIRIASESVQEIKWGDCQKLPSKPSDNFLPDLTFSEDPNALSVILQNDGYPIINRNLEVLALIEDKNGEVIWTDHSSKTVSINNNDFYESIFRIQLKTWQKRLGCRMTVSIDPSYLIHERRKRNNEISIPFGNCEATPDMESGDLLDFNSKVLEEADGFIVSVGNNGRLPMILDHEILQTEITLVYADSSIKKYHIQKRGPLYGFGDAVEVMRIEKASDLCNILIKANPNQLLKESNYGNNNTSFNLCN